VAGAAYATAQAYGQIRGANERLRIGIIGCGGQARDHMRNLLKMREPDNIDILRVCDVYTKRADEAAQLTGAKIARDYRSILDDPNIDYVLIATPEHWHSQMILDAIGAGKHVYTEKPMTRTIEEAKRVTAKMRGSRLQLQVGVQGMSDDSYETAHRYVQEGALGKVVLAQIDYSRNQVGGEFFGSPIEPEARPGENLDWKAFLGPAPKRPWDPDRFFSWRRYWDYSGGIASDLFVHRISRIIKALGLTFPERVTAAGGKFAFPESKAEIPDTLNILADYPGGLTVQLISSMANETGVDHLLRGTRATLKFTRTGFVITPQPQYARDLKEIVHRKTGAEELDLHHRNLINAIRKGEPLKCDHMLGYYGVVVTAMGNLSYRKRKYLRWDAGRERVTNA
jgi:predicted dehydrogenase